MTTVLASIMALYLVAALCLAAAPLLPWRALRGASAWSGAAAASFAFGLTIYVLVLLGLEYTGVLPENVNTDHRLHARIDSLGLRVDSLGAHLRRTPP